MNAWTDLDHGLYDEPHVFGQLLLHPFPQRLQLCIPAVVAVVAAIVSSQVYNAATVRIKFAEAGMQTGAGIRGAIKGKRQNWSKRQQTTKC